MTRNEVIAAWNKQSDYMNKWDSLSEDEKLEWAMKLEREACAKVCEDEDVAPTDDPIGVQWCIAKSIRARGQA